MAYKDYGLVYTDKEYLNLEKRLKRIYSEAEKDIQKQMDVFLDKYEKKNAKYLQAIKDGKATEKEYKQWLRGQVFAGRQWAAKRQSIASTLANVNEVAINMANGRMPNIFQVNGNYAAYQMEEFTGVDLGFSLYNATAVSEIVAHNADILPYKKLDRAKDITWNFQNIKNIVAKGIIKGEGINKIASNLAVEMPNRNMNMVKTHARTMYTSAQNRGRLTRYEEGQAKGIEMEKEWFATLDGRTREAHAEADRQKRPLDEPFNVGGYEMEYPADPHAHPSMVYNCRCTMNSYIKKYPPQYKTRNARDDEGNSVLIKDMSYKEWVKWKGGQ